jgi:acetyl esterase/lipase
MSTKACLALLFSFLTSAALAQAPAAVEREFPSVKLAMERNLEFARVDGKALLLDLYLPSQRTTPLPVLVWIHGEEGRFAGRYPCPIASMIGNGYVVASIDYRGDAEAKVAAQLADCKAAVRWLRANAAKYSLDANQIGAWGFSEGGGLAVLLGATGDSKEFDGTGGNADQSSRVQAVVDFGGSSGAGGDSSPSPVHYASRSSAPMVLLHGGGDKTVAPGQSQSLEGALRKAGVNSTFLLVKGAGHDFKELRQGDKAELVNLFLDKQLKGDAHVRFHLCKIDPPSDAWVDPIIDEPEGTKYMTFPAASLGPGGEASYLIYLPPGYEKSTSKRYPVLYFLHGANGGQRVGDGYVQKLNAAILEHKVPPMIAVMVEGLPTGSYRDSADGLRPIESVIMKDLIPHIDATYRTIPKREARVLEGLSMGGYGVFHLGFKYPEKFGMISGMCNGINASGQSFRGGTAPPQAGYDLAANPHTLAQQNLNQIKGRTPIRIIIGTEDMTWNGNEEFHGFLTKLGIAHEYVVLPNVSHGYKEYYQHLDFTFFKNIATK